MIAPDARGGPVEQADAIERCLETLSFKRRAFGGLDEEDVLVRVREMAGLYRAELDRMREKVEQANDRVARSDERSLAMDRLLLSLQEAKDEIASKAEEEAHALLARAADEAEATLADARREAERLLAQAGEEADAARDEIERGLRDLLACRDELEADLLARMSAAREDLERLGRQASEGLVALDGLAGRLGLEGAWPARADGPAARDAGDGAPRPAGDA